MIIANHRKRCGSFRSSSMDDTPFGRYSPLLPLYALAYANYFPMCNIERARHWKYCSL